MHEVAISNHTLIGIKLAHPGVRFAFNGPTSFCKGCRLAPWCVGRLEKGRIYEVTAIPPDAHEHNCPVFEEGVVTAQVQESVVKIIGKSKFSVEGATLTFHPRNCDNRQCPHKTRCDPSFLHAGDRLKIVAKLDRVECPKNENLSVMRVLRIRH
ncbi:MAG: UPF0179 family protein [Promethearchaeota archaeon]